MDHCWKVLLHRVYTHGGELTKALNIEST